MSIDEIRQAVADYARAARTQSKPDLTVRQLLERFSHRPGEAVGLAVKRRDQTADAVGSQNGGEFGCG